MLLSAEGKWTGMCGELSAGDERATTSARGWSDEFYEPPFIPRIKKIIRNNELRRCEGKS